MLLKCTLLLNGHYEILYAGNFIYFNAVFSILSDYRCTKRLHTFIVYDKEQHPQKHHMFIADSKH